MKRRRLLNKKFCKKKFQMNHQKLPFPLFPNVVNQKKLYILFAKSLAQLLFKKEADMSGKNKSQRLKILTLLFLSDVMVIKEVIRICSGLKWQLLRYYNYDES